MLHTKYLSHGSYGFREEDFLSISNYKSMGADEPRGLANLDHSDMIGRIYVHVGDHLLLHTKYLSSGPYGFNEEDFFIFVSIVSLWELMCPGGRGHLGPYGHGWQDL